MVYFNLLLGDIMETLIFSLLLILIVAFIAGFSVKIVKQQDAAVVEWLGKYSRTLGPGLHFIIPVIESIRSRVSLRIQEIKAEVEVKTKDNMFVALPVSIMIVVDAESAANAYYKLEEKDPGNQIKTWVLNSVRSIASSMSLQELFSDREHIINQVKEVLSTKLKEYGYQIEDVLVDQPSVPDDVQHSFNRVVAAQREAEAATQEGQAVKVKAIALAEAEAESQRIRAKGMADARATLAEGLNNSVKTLSENHVDAAKVMEVIVDLNRLDVLREVGSKGNMIIVDLKGDKKDSEALLALLCKKSTTE